MTTVLLVVQVLLALGIIVLVLIQRSDNDGFGMGSGGGFGVISGRAKANLLTRATAILATLFMLNSLLLAIITSRGGVSSVVDQLPDSPPAVERTVTPEVPAATDAPDATAPEAGTEPAVDAAPDAAPVTEPVQEAPAEAPVVPRAQ